MIQTWTETETKSLYLSLITINRIEHVKFLGYNVILGSGYIAVWIGNEFGKFGFTNTQVVHSYAKDERVGFAEPTSGVELYLCPTRGRTAEIVPRNQLDFWKSLNDDGLIGVIVWRRPQFK